MSSKTNRYTDEFKKQIVNLVNSGKSIGEVANEYKVAKSTVHKWTRDFNNTNSFKAKDNLTDTEKELIEAKKELKQLRMENDILKQAALIMGRK